MTLTLTINKWETYQNRKDVERPHWFRFENRLWRDEQFFRFSAEEKWVWVCLMSYASEKHSADIEFDLEWFCLQANVSEKVLKSSLDRLARNGCVTFTLRPRNADVTSANETVTLHNKTDNTEQNKTNTSRNASHSGFDFEALYKKYPRKEGKSDGLKICKASIKTEEDLAKLNSAIERYAKHCADNQTETKFIRHFDRFMRSWKDWLDPQTGTGPPKAGNWDWDKFFAEVECDPGSVQKSDGKTKDAVA